MFRERVNAACISINQHARSTGRRQNLSGSNTDMRGARSNGEPAATTLRVYNVLLLSLYASICIDVDVCREQLDDVICLTARIPIGAATQ